MMGMKRTLAVVAVAGSLVSGVAQGSPVLTTVFADNFDDGNVSDWIKTTNATGASAVTTRSDLFVSPNYSLYTYFDAPPGGSALWVRASHEFTSTVAGGYFLSLSARSTSCQGCTVYYDVFLDGNSLAHTFQPSAWNNLSIDLNTLSAGSHMLTLGVFSTNAFLGRFNASFDDVVVTGVDLPPVSGNVPEPMTLTLFGLGLAGLAVTRRRRALGAP